ncbi:MAG: DUF4920 domain-containing protein [Gemmatimonadales bacterium]|nr:MAG: DUF4920 domain-containing protein [Gemmatimonadales bacterium]
MTEVPYAAEEASAHLADVVPAGLQFTRFGEDSDPSGARSVETVLRAAPHGIGEPIKVAGPASAVCRNRGCWLSLTGAGGTIIRIDVDRDEDGVDRFTVPVDIAGRFVVAEGTLAEENLMTEATEASDFGEDSEHGATDPGIRIVATSVWVEEAQEGSGEPEGLR